MSDEILTPDLVKAFWAHMQKEFGSYAVQKDNSEIMKIASEVLDALHIQNKEHFMKDFVTTLDKTIYIPFELGSNVDRWPLWNQIRVCVHEHQHVEQAGREGLPTFAMRYLTSASFRAGYEAEAFGTEIEMEFWRTGQIYDIDSRVLVLKDYNCSDADIEMAKQMMTIRAGVVQQGAIESRAAIIAINWLEENVPGLQIVP